MCPSVIFESPLDKHIGGGEGLYTHLVQYLILLQLPKQLGVGFFSSFLMQPYSQRQPSEFLILYNVMSTFGSETQEGYQYGCIYSYEIAYYQFNNILLTITIHLKLYPINSNNTGTHTKDGDFPIQSSHNIIQEHWNSRIIT